QIRSGRAIDPRQPDLLARRTVTASNVLTVTDLFGTVLHTAAPNGPKLPMVGDRVLLPVSDDALFVTVRPSQVPQGGSGSISAGGGVDGGRPVTKTITAPANVFPNGQSGVLNTYDAGRPPAPPPPNRDQVGGAVRIEAVLLDGTVVTQFVNPVTIATTISYNDLLSQFGVSPTDVSYFRFVPNGVAPAGQRGAQTATGAWIPVPTTYNAATGQLIAQVTQPGVYAIFAAEAGRMHVPGAWRNMPLR
ncbi:MAG: hypothetical protein NZ518_05570, partial [Dehalococcoidia bacterium]|nr:hypothetical protein [Dehalococcoidia bacterium]